jgi:hypothetical protein
MKRTIITVAAALLTLAAAFVAGRLTSSKPEPKVETKIKYKTVTVSVPSPPKYEFLKNVIFVPVLPDSTQNDTTDHLVLSDVPTASPDSIAGAYVEIPITQQEYRDTLSQDGVLFSYDIGISGYRPNLEYANFSFPQSVTNTTVIQKESPRIKFDWGLQGGFGYGLINGKADIYVGIGCTIHF